MKPNIQKVGTIDLDMVETTPIVFGCKLYRFEYVRPSYWANPTGGSYFRYIDTQTGNPSPPFAQGNHLGNVFVEDETLFVTGTNIWDGERVDIFCSRESIFANTRAVYRSLILGATSRGSSTWARRAMRGAWHSSWPGGFPRGSLIEIKT